MFRKLTLVLLPMLLSTSCSMIMRNNALMTKMISHFQSKESNRSPREYRIREERTQERAPEILDERPEEDKPDKERSGHVLSLMQNVLCKNFPSVPCDFIIKDDKLRNLIQKSIQQLKYKKITMDRTTHSPKHRQTLFPVVNSEDLSNFLQVTNTGFFKHQPKKRAKKQNPEKNLQDKNFRSHESKNKPKTSVINGRKKIRKYYPHKIKYKDKGGKRDMDDYSDEKLSMSVETPLKHSGNIKRKHFSYRGNPTDPPVWRIDYMKHGEPSLNMFGYEDSLRGKLIKTAPNSLIDDHILEQASRRDVLHPDVYIKTNYPRKTIKDSDGVD